MNFLVLNLAVLGPAGWSYLQTVCEQQPALGVIVCTGRSSVSQPVRGLRLGADDWVTKPCHPVELIARAETVARRRRRAEATRTNTGPLRVGELEVRSDLYQVFASGISVELTRREFELISLLADATGQVLRREEIHQRVWGYAMAYGDRSVNDFVRKLRQKLERTSPNWRYIPHALRDRLPLLGGRSIRQRPRSRYRSRACRSRPIPSPPRRPSRAEGGSQPSPPTSLPTRSRRSPTLPADPWDRRTAAWHQYWPSPQRRLFTRARDRPLPCELMRARPPSSDRVTFVSHFSERALSTYCAFARGRTRMRTSSSSGPRLPVA